MVNRLCAAGALVVAGCQTTSSLYGNFVDCEPGDLVVEIVVSDDDGEDAPGELGRGWFVCSDGDFSIDELPPQDDFNLVATAFRNERPWLVAYASVGFYGPSSPTDLEIQGGLQFESAIYRVSGRAGCATGDLVVTATSLDDPYLTPTVGDAAGCQGDFEIWLRRGRWDIELWDPQYVAVVAAARGVEVIDLPVDLGTL